MNERVDLAILNKTKYNDYIKVFENIKKADIGTLYAKVTTKNLSEIRKEMIKDDFTTRLFVARLSNQNVFYIYGKKKGKKGTFNEHCKNTCYSYNSVEDFYIHIINASSNEGETVFVDDKKVKTVVEKLKRVSINEK
jgi:hypothetical protein